MRFVFKEYCKFHMVEFSFGQVIFLGVVGGSVVGVFVGVVFAMLFKGGGILVCIGNREDDCVTLRHVARHFVICHESQQII